MTWKQDRLGIVYQGERGFPFRKTVSNPEVFNLLENGKNRFSALIALIDTSNADGS